MFFMDSDKTVKILTCTNIGMVFLCANSDDMALKTIISKSVNESWVFRTITF